MRLSRRISLIIIPFVTVPLILVGIYSYYLLWHRNIENSHAQLERVDLCCAYINQPT
jgi:hypothetical protein